MKEYVHDLVSVCIPAYNQEDTIQEAVRSALNQTYKNIEVVVIDDCSKDHTVAKIREINDDRVRLIENENNLGMVANWNKAVMSAKGEYAIMLHGDDRLHPDSIRHKMEMFQKDKKVVLAFSATRIIDGAGKTIMERHAMKGDVIINGKRFAKKSYHHRNMYGEPSNILFRTELVEKLGGFDDVTCYTTDWLMWMEISSYGKVGYVDEVLMDYRIDADNMTSRIKFIDMIRDDEVMTKMISDFERLDINGFDRFCHRFFIYIRTFLRVVYIKFKILKNPFYKREHITGRKRNG
ncbi:MAG: glycosyltransferase [Lachnospiraceae bacterium]|nr:glycosyltransferase [Lachnospiraceae bacterium]